MRRPTAYGDQRLWKAGVTMWVFLGVLLVGFVLTLTGVGISLYFYRQGLVKSSKAEKYLSPNPFPPGTQEYRDREEERFYEELVLLENGPSRFSLLIASVVIVLLCGLMISAIVGMFAR